MKKILFVLMISLTSLLISGCQKPKAMDIENSEKRIRLGLMNEPNLNEFRVIGNIKSLNNVKDFDYDIDSYTSLEESYNYTILKGEEDVVIFISDNKLYLDYKEEKQYTELENVEIDHKAIEYCQILAKKITTLKLDSKKMLDNLTIYKKGFGYQYVYKLTKDVLDEEFTDSVDESSYINLILETNGNTLSEIKADGAIIYQYENINQILEFDLKMDIAMHEVNLPDFDLYEYVEKIRVLELLKR